MLNFSTIWGMAKRDNRLTKLSATNPHTYPQVLWIVKNYNS